MPTLCIVGKLYWDMIRLWHKHHQLTFTKRNAKRVWNLSSRKSLHIFSIKVRILNAVILMRIYSTVITRNSTLNGMYSFSSTYQYTVHLHVKVGIAPPQGLRRYIYSETVRPAELVLTNICHVWAVTERSSYACVRVRISQPFWPEKQSAIQAQTIPHSQGGKDETSTSQNGWRTHSAHYSTRSINTMLNNKVLNFVRSGGLLKITFEEPAL